MAATKNATAAVNTAPIKDAATAGSEDDEFVVHEGIKVVGESGNWTPTKSVTASGKKTPLVGWCIRTEPRTSPKYPDKPYISGIVEIVQPVMVVASDNTVKKQSKGLVSLTLSVAQLTDLIEKFDDTEKVYKYQFHAAARSERANGHTFQEYEVDLLDEMTRVDYEAMKIAKIQNLLGSGAAASKQLSAGEA